MKDDIKGCLESYSLPNRFINLFQFFFMESLVSFVISPLSFIVFSLLNNDYNIWEVRVSKRLGFANRNRDRTGKGEETGRGRGSCVYKGSGRQKSGRRKGEEGDGCSKGHLWNVRGKDEGVRSKCVNFRL